MRKYIFVLMFGLLIVNFSYADVNEVASAEVRTANPDVMSKCWGEDCTAGKEGAVFKPIEQKVSNKPKSVTYSANETYISDKGKETKTKTMKQSAKILDFVSAGDTSILGKMLNKGNDFVSGKVNKKDTPKNLAEKKAWETVVNSFRNEYRKIEVCGYTFYIATSSLMYDNSNYVFSTKDGKSILVYETDDNNDVFNTTDAGKYGAKIVNATEKGVDYAIENGQYFLCENCSCCLECHEKVGVGTTYAGPAYFSRYCPTHACGFLYSAYVNFSNEEKENIECRDKKGKGDFCETHTCHDTGCANPICGRVIVDSRIDAKSSYEGILDGGYSKYCYIHRCIAYGCGERRTGENLLSNTYDINEVSSPKYCPAHSCGCKVVVSGGELCNRPVTIDTYAKAGFRMICEGHLSGELTDAIPVETCAVCHKKAFTTSVDYNKDGIAEKICKNCSQELMAKLALSYVGNITYGSALVDGSQMDCSRFVVYLFSQFYNDDRFYKRVDQDGVLGVTVALLRTMLTKVKASPGWDNNHKADFERLLKPFTEMGYKGSEAVVFSDVAKDLKLSPEEIQNFDFDAIMQPGDVIFRYDCGANGNWKIAHAEIYIGHNRIVSCASETSGCIVFTIKPDAFFSKPQNVKGNEYYEFVNVGLGGI